MSFSKTLYPLLSYGSAQEDPSHMTEKLLTDIKNQNTKLLQYVIVDLDHILPRMFVLKLSAFDICCIICTSDYFHHGSNFKQTL